MGVTQAGTPVERLTLRRADQTGLSVLTYGATWVHWWLPDQDGCSANVLAAPATLAGVEADRHFMGATVGRYANRLAGGRFELGGQTYQVPPNEDDKALHGGVEGFHRQCWKGSFTEVNGDPAIAMTRTSPDGEMGFPGNLEVRVDFVLLPSGGVRIISTATTDATTIVSLTNHAYFNLAGFPTTESGQRMQTPDVLSHEIWSGARQHTPVDDAALPTGEIASVAGTPFDLRSGRLLLDLTQDAILGEGLDNNYVFTDHMPKPDWIGAEAVPAGSRLMAWVAHNGSGRRISVSGTLPGLQIYLGQGLPAKGGTFPAYTGLCLETQHFPDAPNQPNFPSPVLEPGETWQSTTTYAPG